MWSSHKGRYRQFSSACLLARNIVVNDFPNKALGDSYEKLRKENIYFNILRYICFNSNNATKRVVRSTTNRLYTKIKKVAYNHVNRSSKDTLYDLGFLYYFPRQAYFPTESEECMVCEVSYLKNSSNHINQTNSLWKQFLYQCLGDSRRLNVFLCVVIKV